MANVRCEITENEIENEDGYPIPSVTATCLACGYTTESFGTGGSSRRRCLALMREGCPRGDTNFYVDEDELR